MTPKEKAKELVFKYTSLTTNEHSSQHAIYCALTAVDENVKTLKELLNESKYIYQSLNTPKKLCIDLLNPLLKYWYEVQQEIEKL